MGPLLVGVGLLVTLVGALIWLGLPIGRLPGDLIIRREDTTIYVPITTSILVSLVLTAIGLLLRR
jgi:hypothetical protein